MLLIDKAYNLGVIRTMSIAMYPSRLQAAQLERYLFVGRVAFNRALESRIHWYKTSGNTLSFYEQCADLTAIRAADKFWSDVPVQIERDALRRLDLAYKHFFRRVKERNGKAGFPRFKGRNRWESFSVNDPGQVVRNGRIRVSGLNLPIRCRNLRPVEGDIKQQRIVRRAGKWFCQLVIDDGNAAPPLVPIRSAVGIDVGLTKFAVLSNGESVNNPRFGKRLARKLAHAHRLVSQTTKGSRNRRKRVCRLQRVYRNISDARLNFTHHASKAVVSKHQFIAVEDLNIAGMVRGRFAKGILDACWSQFIFQCGYKAEGAGATLLKVEPRGTSQECSGCGENVPKDLSVRVHSCPGCGLVIGRDLNAAKNILRRALHSSDHRAAVGRSVMPVEEFVGTPSNQEVLATHC